MTIDMCMCFLPPNSVIDCKTYKDSTMQVLVLHMDCPLHLIHLFSKIESLFFLGTWNPSK
jgi:hypothetical protein